MVPSNSQQQRDISILLARIPSALVMQELQRQQHVSVGVIRVLLTGQKQRSHACNTAKINIGANGTILDPGRFRERCKASAVLRTVNQQDVHAHSLSVLSLPPAALLRSVLRTTILRRANAGESGRLRMILLCLKCSHDAFSASIAGSLIPVHTHTFSLLHSDRPIS
jgi:hypothetical protein